MAIHQTLRNSKGIDNDSLHHGKSAPYPLRFDSRNHAVSLSQPDKESDQIHKMRLEEFPGSILHRLVESMPRIIFLNVKSILVSTLGEGTL